MYGQVFELSDIVRVIGLVFIELALSADNAIVLGLLVHSLPHHLRGKALYIGVFSAFILRGLALLAISFLLANSWIRLLGAAYLIYLSARHFLQKAQDPSEPKKSTSFWKTVMHIELFDLAFAIDSILAGVAFIGPTTSVIHPKLWIVYMGGMLGLLGMRYAATFFTSLIDRFPRLSVSAHLMIAWIGLELAIHVFWPHLPYGNFVYWSVIFLLFGYGFTGRKKDPA